MKNKAETATRAQTPVRLSMTTLTSLRHFSRMFIAVPSRYRAAW